MLDTDMIIFMLRGLKPSARQRARRERALALVARCREAQAKGDVVGLSAITISELEFGAHNSGDYGTEIVAVQEILTPFEVYDYDGATCPAHYGRIRHELERAGQAIGAMDLLIAAHALALPATLVTNNLAHFQRISGLSVARWPCPAGLSTRITTVSRAVVAGIVSPSSILALGNGSIAPRILPRRRRPP
jgi:tRNA(fMet)-specific endonuclease VapC